nr:MAG TPA: hypothetical protein [Caudoviricetes sp.]
MYYCDIYYYHLLCHNPEGILLLMCHYLYYNMPQGIHIVYF